MGSHPPGGKIAFTGNVQPIEETGKPLKKAVAGFPAEQLFHVNIGRIDNQCTH